MDRTLALRPAAGSGGALLASTLWAVPASGPLPAGYQVRSAGPRDAGLIREFVCGLSVRTQYFRFFTAASPPSSGLLRALTGEGTSRSDILIITDDYGAVIGHGMAVDATQDGELCTDIGLVIADRWQGQGLGTMLLGLLADRAAERGVAALVLEVLPANTRMLGIVARHWPDAARKRTPDALVITASMAARQPTRPSSPAGGATASYRGPRQGPGRSAA
jgi:ribosomal protein S18 acetylase RimI-like enzyme